MAAKAQQVEALLAGLVDTNGQPLASGTVTFQATGTTTAKTIYADANKSDTLANPVTLDSRGRKLVFADGLYKMIVKDSTGVTLDTIDSGGLGYATALSKIDVDIYVNSAAADDTGDGFTAGTAKKYLKSGLVLAEDYIAANTVTIHVEAGTYGHTTNDKNWALMGFHPVHGSFTKSPKVIISAENGTVILDTQFNGTPPNSGTAVGGMRIDFSWVQFKGNWKWIDGSGTNNIIGLLIDHTSRVEYDTSAASTFTIDGVGSSGIEVRDASRVDLKTLDIKNCGGDGIAIDNARLSVDGALTIATCSENGIQINRSGTFIVPTGNSNALSITNNSGEGIQLQFGGIFEFSGSGNITVTGNSKAGIGVREGSQFYFNPSITAILFKCDSNTESGISIHRGSSFIVGQGVLTCNSNLAYGIFLEKNSVFSWENSATGNVLQAKANSKTGVWVWENSNFYCPFLDYDGQTISATLYTPKISENLERQIRVFNHSNATIYKIADVAPVNTASATAAEMILIGAHSALEIRGKGSGSFCNAQAVLEKEQITVERQSRFAALHTTFKYFSATQAVFNAHYHSHIRLLGSCSITAGSGTNRSALNGLSLLNDSTNITAGSDTLNTGSLSY